MERCSLQAAKRGRLVYGSILAVTLAVMTAATSTVWIEQEQVRAAAERISDLHCLAENVYYESRGEPLVGQYAVAEVAMNRVASPEFPDSVCEVVHSLGAFSWTYEAELTTPFGYEWRRAQAVANSVYDNLEAPLVNGALYYHATRITPDWAATRLQVAIVGRHLFYL